MSILRNLLGGFVPVRERREAAGTINALNGSVTIDVNGDESAAVYVASSAFVGTLIFEGTVDGTNYFAVPAYPFAPGCAGGTIPQSGQPLLIHALVAANTAACYSVLVGQLRALRVRASLYTSGSAAISMVAEAQQPMNSAIAAKPTTLVVTATAAAGTAVTATLPAVTGLRHVIDLISVTRVATAALTASATPVLVTTTNLPGLPILTFGSDAGGIGVDKTAELNFGSTGLAATALGTASTVVCPAYVGVIWRVNVSYRLGV